MVAFNIQGVTKEGVVQEDPGILPGFCGSPNPLPLPEIRKADGGSPLIGWIGHSPGYGIHACRK